MSSDRPVNNRPPGPSRREAQLRALLDEGIAAAQRGQVERARRLFEGALAIDGSQEEAWLWLAAMTTDRDLARAIYQRVLVAHPDSARAREALRWLDQAEADATPPATPSLEEGDEEPLALSPQNVEEEPPAAPVAPLPEPDLEGPALFVPPWEIGTPVPVLEGPQPTLADAAPWTASPGSAAGGPLGGEPIAVEPEADQPIPSKPEVVAQAALVDPPVTVTVDDQDPPEADRADGASEIEGTPAQIEPPTIQSAHSAPEYDPLPSEEIIVSDTPVNPLPETPPPPAAQSAVQPTPPAESVAPIGLPPLQGQAFEPMTPRPAQLLRHGLMFAMLGFVLLGSLGMIAMLGNQSRADKVRLALGVITDTPTITPTFTITPTPTATRTPTPTLTPTPSPTLSPTPTFTPSPTPTPSWVTQRYLPLPLEEKWIEVDLSEQTLVAYEGVTVVYETKISSGKNHTPTLEGKFRIMRKFESQLMAGPGYYLPGVPWVMYFYGGYALHGAYWHDKWGTPTSHGCVNLKIEDAKWIYEWSDPVVPEGAKALASTKEKPGTWVLIHK